MTQATYREAVREALREALHSDPRVFLMGEDVGRYGGTYACSRGLFEEFGPDRIRDAPLSESAFVGAGIGAALGGMRPIVEVMTVNFSMLAMDQILNNAATIRHMSGGQFSVPIVIRMTTGGGRQVAAQHSHSLEGWYAHIPGLKVLMAGTVADARTMLRAALADPDPVIIFEHGYLYPMTGDLDDGGGVGSVWESSVRRHGNDLTVVTWGGSLWKVLEASEALAAQGIQTDVIDLRALRPLDMEPVLASVARTHRVLVVEEEWRTGGFAAEVSAQVVERAFYELDRPVARLASAEVPVPYPKHLEDAALPSVERITRAALEVAGHG